MDNRWESSGSLTLAGALVVDREDGRLTRRDITVDGGLIVEVSRPRRPPTQGSVIDATDLIAIPGLVNAHTHAHNNLVKGTGDCRSLEMHSNALAAALMNRQPRDHYLSAAIGAIEMVKSGATCAYDMASVAGGPDPTAIAAVVQAYTDVGMRVTVAPTFSNIPLTVAVPGLMQRLSPELQLELESRTPGLTVDEIVRMVVSIMSRHDGSADGRIRIAVGPSVPNLCTDELLRAAGDLSRRLGIGLHTHVSESRVQALHSLECYGRSIVARLSNLGLLGPAATLAHAVWLTTDDIQAITRSQSSVVHNPASNLKLGSGIAPVRKWLEAGINVALGTDGTASSDNQNMFQSMWLAALTSHVRYSDVRKWLTASEVFAMATKGGARAIGLPDDLGAIERGRLADIVLLRLSSTSLSPLNDLVNQLVYADTARAVDTVIVGGRVIVKDGQCVLVDENKLMAECRTAASRLVALNARHSAAAEVVEKHLREMQGNHADVPLTI